MLITLSYLYGQYSLGGGGNKFFGIKLFHMQIAKIQLQTFHAGGRKKNGIVFFFSQLIDAPRNIAPYILQLDILPKGQKLSFPSGGRGADDGVFLKGKFFASIYGFLSDND